MVQPLLRTVWRLLKKLKTELPLDLAIPLLGMDPQKNMFLKGTYTPMFIVALLIIMKTCTQSLQSYPTLCDPMDHGPPGSHGILQARKLEWVAISFSNDKV